MHFVIQYYFSISPSPSLSLPSALTTLFSLTVPLVDRPLVGSVPVRHVDRGNFSCDLSSAVFLHSLPTHSAMLRGGSASLYILND